MSAIRSVRKVSRLDKPDIQTPINQVARNECDTNADTCCLGCNFVVLGFTTRTADVFPYDKSYDPMTNVPIVKGGTAYDDPVTGATYILVFNEGLYYGSKLDHSLINPNQVRSYGVPFWDNPYDDLQGLCIEATDELTIPMSSQGTKIFFTSRTPTERELRTCPHITLTSNLEWNPNDVRLSQVRTEKEPPFFKVTMSEDGDNQWSYLRHDIDATMLNEIDPTLIQLKERIISTLSFTTTFEDVPTRNTFVSTERHSTITAETLAERFLIGPDRARATLKATTQKGLRSAILPISRRYRADRTYDVKRLNGKFASDTL